MKKRILLVLTVIIGLAVWQCSRNINGLTSRNGRELKNLHLSKDEIAIANQSQQFGFNLLQKIDEQVQNSNIIISPLSISMALGMTLNGASGSTYDSMATVLGFSGMSDQTINTAYQGLIGKLRTADRHVLFELANSIWYRNTFTVLQDFIHVNRDYFDARIFPADFSDPATVNRINDWVKEQTHQKITNIIDHIDRDAVMFLMNAIYLKAIWMYKFDTKNTRDDRFYAEGGDSSLPCRMMHIRGKFDYYEDARLQAVDIPYGNGNFSMTLLLPKTGVLSVQDLISGLDNTRWQQIINHFNADSGDIALPKFKLRFHITLNPMLEALGMANAFNPAQADFSRINPTARLFISFVKHKTFIQVDEEGTEAAAVTIVGMWTTSVNPPQGFMIFMNHPFVFILREKTSGSILFMGKITDPRWEE